MEEDHGANSYFVNWNGQPLLVIENDDDSDKKTKKRRSKRFRLQQKLKAMTEELERTQAELARAYGYELGNKAEPTLQEIQDIARKMAEESHDATMNYRKHAAAEFAQQSAR